MTFQIGSPRLIFFDRIDKGVKQGLVTDSRGRIPIRNQSTRLHILEFLVHHLLKRLVPPFGAARLQLGGRPVRRRDHGKVRFGPGQRIARRDQKVNGPGKDPLQIGNDPSTVQQIRGRGIAGTTTGMQAQGRFFVKQMTVLAELFGSVGLFGLGVLAILLAILFGGWWLSHQIFFPPPIQTMCFPSFGTNDQRMLHHQFVQRRGARLLGSQNHKRRRRSSSLIDQSIDGPAGLQESFARLQKNAWLGRHRIGIIQNEVDAIIVTAIADGVSTLIVHFKHVSRRTIDAFQTVVGATDAKENFVGLGDQNGHVDAVRMLNPNARIVVQGNGRPGRQTGQQESHNAIRRYLETVENGLDGLPDILPGMPPGQIVEGMQKVVRKHQDNLANPPGIVRGSDNVNIVNARVNGIPQVGDRLNLVGRIFLGGAVQWLLLFGWGLSRCRFGGCWLCLSRFGCSSSSGCLTRRLCWL